MPDGLCAPCLEPSSSSAAPSAQILTLVNNLASDHGKGVLAPTTHTRHVQSTSLLLRSHAFPRPQRMLTAGQHSLDEVLMTPQLQMAARLPACAFPKPAATPQHACSVTPNCHCWETWTWQQTPLQLHRWWCCTHKAGMPARLCS